jgi:hypothetical protein
MLRPALRLCSAFLNKRKMDNIPETQQTDLEEMPPPAKKSRRRLWLILGVALVLVLAAAAFLGGRYLQNGSLSTGGNIGGLFGGPGMPKFSKNELIPAPELPKTTADVNGIFVRRQNNSFFVGTGQLQLSVINSTGGTPQIGSSYDGPVVEVVTTTNTKIYKEVTNLNESPQQKVDPGSLDDIGQNSRINAWGKKTGNRLVADVLLYWTPTPPPVRH